MLDNEEKDSINSNGLKKVPFKLSILIAVVSVVVLVTIIVIVLNGKRWPVTEENNISTGTNINSGTSSKDTRLYNPTELEKRVKVDSAVTEDGNLVVFITNNNDVIVDIETEVEFYDANGTFVGASKGSLQAIGKGIEVALEIWDTPTNWDNYKIYTNLEQSNSYCYFDKLNVTHSNNGEKIAIQVANNSADIIESITVAVVYYQDNNVVGIEDDFESDIRSGRTANFTLDFPHDSEYNNVKFDNYKVFVNEAYSYK